MSQVQENKCDPTAVASAGIYSMLSEEGNLHIYIKCHNKLLFVFISKRRLRKSSYLLSRCHIANFITITDAFVAFLKAPSTGHDQLRMLYTDDSSLAVSYRIS